MYKNGAFITRVVAVWVPESVALVSIPAGRVLLTASEPEPGVTQCAGVPSPFPSHDFPLAATALANDSESIVVAVTTSVFEKFSTAKSFMSISPLKPQLRKSVHML